MLPSKYYEKLALAARQAPLESIENAIKLISETIDENRSIFVCGNGGSALTASHYVTDWGKMRWVNQKKQFKVYCLSDNIGMLTAYSNDVSYENVYAEALKNYASKSDLLIVVSGSGNSENVVQAIKAAKEMKIKSIGICGFSGGHVKDLCDLSVHYPVKDMQIVEDLHLSFGHIVMKQLCN